eukprot:3835929-Prymnesium_polylepis.2
MGRPSLIWVEWHVYLPRRPLERRCGLGRQGHFGVGTLAAALAAPRRIFADGTQAGGPAAAVRRVCAPAQRSARVRECQRQVVGPQRRQQRWPVPHARGRPPAMPR